MVNAIQTRSLPEVVELGFCRDDLGRECEATMRRPWFYDGKSPEVGQLVKVLIEYKRPMFRGEASGLTDAGLEGLPIDERYTIWSHMGGRVVEVINERRLKLRVSPSSLNTPPEMEGPWDATLAYDEEYEFPWVLESMTRCCEW